MPHMPEGFTALGFPMHKCKALTAVAVDVRNNDSDGDGDGADESNEDINRSQPPSDGALVVH